MIRRTFSRRSFFGLLGAAPLAMPAVMRAAAEPVTVGADVQADRLVVSTYRSWREVEAPIRAEEAAIAPLAIGLDSMVEKIRATKAILADLDGSP